MATDTESKRLYVSESIKNRIKLLAHRAGIGLQECTEKLIMDCIDKEGQLLAIFPKENDLEDIRFFAEKWDMVDEYVISRIIKIIRVLFIEEELFDDLIEEVMQLESNLELS